VTSSSPLDLSLVVAGSMVVYSAVLLDKIQARSLCRCRVSVHLTCGVWGTLPLESSHNRAFTFITQLTGRRQSVERWLSCVSFIFFILKRTWNSVF